MLQARPYLRSFQNLHFADKGVPPPLPQPWLSSVWPSMLLSHLKCHHSCCTSILGSSLRQAQIQDAIDTGKTKYLGGRVQFRDMQLLLPLALPSGGCWQKDSGWVQPHNQPLPQSRDHLLQAAFISEEFPLSGVLPKSMLSIPLVILQTSKG